MQLMAYVAVPHLATCLVSNSEKAYCWAILSAKLPPWHKSITKYTLSASCQAHHYGDDDY
jgi:hypothetical protein